MSYIFSDENQVPSLSNESKKRQSCPAQLSQLSQRSFGSSSQILGDSTNMRRSFVDNQKNIFFTQQKESVSSRYSEPVYSCQSEIKPQSLASKSQLRQSIIRDEIIEEELSSSSSKMKNNSMLRNSQISQDQSFNQQLSQESSVSNKSNSSSKDKLSMSSTKSGEALSSDTDRATTSCPKKTFSILQKIIVFSAISLLAFLIVIGGKFFFTKAISDGGLSSYYNSEHQFKNKYFEQQIVGERTSNLATLENGTESTTHQQNAVKEISDKFIKKEDAQDEEEYYRGPKEVDLANNDLHIKSSLEQMTNNRSQDNSNQSNLSRQEMLIKEEAEQLFSTLIKVVQKEGRISYLQFDEYLINNCTPVIIERVKAKIQSLVDESESIKEELNIENGARFYVNQEKYY